MNAEFVVSAASARDFPATGLPEVALVGRSNVGKSTLINALTRQTVARTSAAPGKTRLANFYLVNAAVHGRPARFYLVDLPGYGYARGGAEPVRSFARLASEYFDASTRAVRQIVGALQLIDSRHPDLPQDAASVEWLATVGVPFAIVATKTDKLKQAERAAMMRTVTARYESPVIPIAATEGRGLDEVWKQLREWIESTR